MDDGQSNVIVVLESLLKRVLRVTIVDHLVVNFLWSLLLLHCWHCDMLVKGNALGLRHLVPQSLLIEDLLLVLHDIGFQLLHVLSFGQLSANFQFSFELSNLKSLLRRQVHSLHNLALSSQFVFVERLFLFTPEVFVDKAHANNNQQYDEACCSNHYNDLFLTGQVFTLQTGFS